MTPCPVTPAAAVFTDTSNFSCKKTVIHPVVIIREGRSQTAGNIRQRRQTRLRPRCPTRAFDQTRVRRRKLGCSPRSRAAVAYATSLLCDRTLGRRRRSRLLRSAPREV